MSPCRRSRFAARAVHPPSRSDATTPRKKSKCHFGKTACACRHRTVACLQLFECGLCYRDERWRDAAFFFADFFFADFRPAFFTAPRFFARLADFAGGPGGREGAGAADATFRAPPRRASAVRGNATPAAATAAARIASPAMSRTASAPLCAAAATFFWVVL